MNDRERMLWSRAALGGGGAAALLILALHTRIVLHYFGPLSADLKGLLPSWGPHFFMEWGRHLGRLGAAALFFASLPGLGRLAAGFYSPPAGKTSPFETPGAAAATGLLLWSMAGFIMAAAGLSSPAILKGVSILLTGAGLIADAGMIMNLGRRAKTLFWPRATEPKLLLAASCLAAFFYLLTTVVPDTFYDALVYHLAAPQAWLQNGRMTDMPDLHLWRLPGLLQPLYLWALAWSDDRLCKLLTLGIGLMAAVSLARVTARHFGPAAGGWAALLFLTSPMIGVNLWSCANDIPSGFFLFLALTHWGAAKTRRDVAPIALAGFFLGAAAATKTNALFTAPFFLLDFLWRLKNAPARDKSFLLKSGLLFTIFAVLPLAPWWIRNMAWTGNPFFPQAAFLGGDTPENIALLAGWQAERSLAGGFLPRILSLARESFFGIEAGRFGFVGPALLMFLPLAFFLRPRDGAAKTALRDFTWAAMSSYVFYVFATGRLRYFIPQLLPLFALAGACLADYAAALRARPGARGILKQPGAIFRGLAAATAALNLLWMGLVYQRFNQGWDVVWGRVLPAEYLKKEHTGVYGHPSQAAFDRLAEERVTGKLFILGETRTFRSPIPASASGNFNVPGFARRLAAAPEPERFIAVLKAEGYTHLLLNFPEMKRLTPAGYRDDAHLRGLGAVLDRLAPPLHADPWTALFELK